MVLAIVGLVVVAGLFAQRAWTRFATMAKVAKTSEAVQNLEHIQQAQAAYFGNTRDATSPWAPPSAGTGTQPDGLRRARTNGCDWAGSPIHPCVASTRSPSPTHRLSGRGPLRCGWGWHGVRVRGRSGWSSPADLTRRNEAAARSIRGTDLAECVGLTQADLSKLKIGRVKAIRFSTLRALCRNDSTVSPAIC